MTKVLMIVYFMGMHGYTPPVLETQIVTSSQCVAAKQAIAELTNDTTFILCIANNGDKL